MTKFSVFILFLVTADLFAAPTTLWQDGAVLHEKMRGLDGNPKQVFQRRTLIRDTHRGANREPILKFDYPIEYNRQVQFWIKHFQTDGRKVFLNWLKRSQKYLPHVRRFLKEEGLPGDLAYIAMIESGFVAQARSPAAAVGPWQFISETGNRYGLETSWWLDERMDFEKSTRAAAKYLKYLYSMFNCWNLAAAGYNTGENRIARLVEKHNTKSFWEISKFGGISRETQNYVPKLIATMLIAKAPELYGFNHVPRSFPLRYEKFSVPGGTRLDYLARHLGIGRDLMRDLNPELLRGYIPFHVVSHSIRIPPGTAVQISKIIRAQLVSSNDEFTVIGKN